MINVLIGGDVCPVGKNLPYFRCGDAERIFDGLLGDFKEADLSIVNLECPLINETAPILKTGPVLGVPSDCINGLKEAGIDVANLANNHIMDHGPTGLKNTLKVCASAGISTVGAGKDIQQARRILIRQIGGIRVGILGVAEHEFSIATHSSCGANPMDLADFVRNLRDHRDTFDYLVVLLHGGNEHYTFPSPRLKDTCHFMVEMGANAVIVQHTHCPGSYEQYRNGHIVYGQGNLIFEWPNRDRSFYEGFLVRLSITEDLNSSMSIIPYEQSTLQAGVKKMNERVEHLFRQSLRERSFAITDDTFIQNQWAQFCKNKAPQYLNYVFGHNRIIRKLNQYGPFAKLLYTIPSLCLLRNIISCEAHREVIETVLGQQLYKRFN